MVIPEKVLPSKRDFKIVPITCLERDSTGYFVLLRGDDPVTYAEDAVRYDSKKEVYWVCMGQSERKKKGGRMFEIIYTWKWSPK